MAYSLRNNCTKIIGIRQLLLKIMDGGWMVSFFETQYIFIFIHLIGSILYEINNKINNSKLKSNQRKLN